jgi:hypothetical protein
MVVIPWTDVRAVCRAPAPESIPYNMVPEKCLNKPTSDRAAKRRGGEPMDLGQGVT